MGKQSITKTCGGGKGNVTNETISRMVVMEDWDSFMTGSYCGQVDNLLWLNRIPTTYCMTANTNMTLH